MACFEPYQLFSTIITWLLISRSGYQVRAFHSNHTMSLAKEQWASNITVPGRMMVLISKTSCRNIQTPPLQSNLISITTYLTHFFFTGVYKLEVVVVPKIRSLSKNSFSMILRLEIILSVMFYERKNIFFMNKFRRYEK